MGCEFDRVIDRRKTNSLKYDFAVQRGKPADVLPLWVADMDFRTAQPILDALHRAVEHGIFGYSEVGEDYTRAVSAWFGRHFGWAPQSEWLVKTPGVVYALAAAVRSLTAPGDGVLIQPPVYYPFYSVIRDNGRTLVESELRYDGARYEIDFADFEAKIAAGNVRLFLLCSPHNPVGRVWTKDELERLGEICRRHGVIVVSDEIHCDFAFPGHPHTIFAAACPSMAERAIICTAPSKTFNLAGLQVSNIWIPGAELRQSFLAEMNRSGYSQLNTLGLVAAQAAYTEGDAWQAECREYLRGNLNFLRGFLRERLPEIRLVEPEGTYLAWLDCSALGLSAEALDELITERAGLWLDAGEIFGKCASAFQRMVLACPRKTLEQALLRLERALRGA